MTFHSAMIWLTMMTAGTPASSVALAASPASAVASPSSVVVRFVSTIALANLTPRQTGEPSRLYTPDDPGPTQPPSRSTATRRADGPAATPSRASDAAAGSVAESADPDGQNSLTARQVVESARLSPRTALVLIAVSLLITGATLWSAFRWWHIKNEAPTDAAFRILSRRLRLSHADRATIARRATDTGVPPIALLVSPSAMRAALVSPR